MLLDGKKVILEVFKDITGVKSKKQDKEYEKALNRLFSKYQDMPTKEELEEVFLGKKIENRKH